MVDMFYECNALTSLDLSSFVTSSTTFVEGIFKDSPSLSMLKLGKDFGNVVEKHGLTNEGGWVNSNDPSTIASGTGEFAEIVNSGTNTYIRNGGTIITEPPMMGDVNGDRSANIADAVLLQKWLLNKPDSDLPEWTAADIYEDGKLNVYDLVLLKQMITE